MRRFLCSKRWRSGLSLLMLVLSSRIAAAATANSGVQISQSPDRLRIEVDGELLTEYHFATNMPRPFCHPLVGPGGVVMTRQFPLTSPPGEEHDHPHHRGLWFAHGKVNGVDFWTEGAGKGRIVHAGFDVIQSGAAAGVVKSRNRWLAADGREICTDDRTLRVYSRGARERLLDFEITLHAAAGELKLGDTKEGLMALRVAETMRVTRPAPLGTKAMKAEGRIVLSTGARDGAAWGQRATWCDYSGPVNGQVVGVAMFDHPDNPRYPTWWMVRDYGLLAANPIGQHEFEKSTKPNSGDLSVPAGGSITFRYRLLLHEGDEVQGRVAYHQKEFVQSGTPAVK